MSTASVTMTSDAERIAFQKACDALEDATAAGYRQMVSWQADVLIRAATPHIVDMLSARSLDEATMKELDRDFDWPPGSMQMVINQLAEHGLVLIERSTTA
ncbi:MAG TPA: hypothetical protein VK735_39730 [Pseudonocardia sp.]|uniref:hypothetical protein n=1 Tax=Pseudonocardia sp. TaxID=60912 RepID=UPI002D1473B7|nr:hypothetical protein [Pseudonocardia sp.]HTF53614.1 hypothetical protein [Pseudonocardia sp.]